ncbi:hypothetical protein [Burkholderia multivorans]|uniref:hypothetical protein n=1 Tax=Burkholderia multivorans TaxID=87883 RepID=UPI0021C1C30E|nr:hypothetical protein [Burkholderia multivorans]
MSDRAVSGRAVLYVGDGRYELIACCDRAAIERMRDAAARLTDALSKLSITFRLTTNNSRTFDLLFKSAPPPRKRRAEWKKKPLERYAR